MFYTKFGLADTFQNRIHLIFLHISFVFIKLKERKENLKYKDFSQEMFDFIFVKIELNMREIGYGDVSVNKNMKGLVKIFYSILLNCEKFKSKSLKERKSFLLNYLTVKNSKISENNNVLAEYFDKFNDFCFDLTTDSVLSGELNFKY